MRAQTFTPSSTKSGDKLTGQLAAKYTFAGGIESEATLTTGGVLSLTLEAVDAITKGLTATFDCETVAPGKAGVLSSGKCTVDYKQEMYTGKASYDYYKGDLNGSPLPPAPARSYRPRPH